MLRGASKTGWHGGTTDEEHASAKFSSEIAVIGIVIGKNSFHIVGLDRRGAIVLRQSPVNRRRWLLCTQEPARYSNIKLVVPDKPDSIKLGRGISGHDRF